MNQRNERQRERLPVRGGAMAPVSVRPRRHRSRRCPGPLVAAALLLAAVAALLLWKPWQGDDTGGEASAPPIEESGQPSPSLFPSPVVPVSVEPPDWVVQNLLPVNEYSRPGTALTQVNGVVVHYVGNPGTTAEQNRSYFANLAETHETWASSHFVVGMDGTVVQCVPLDEIAYCSNYRNDDTISIECCHPDDTGEFTQKTVDALVRLLDWLIRAYGLERADILRHYDVNGKECPRYYVRNPDAWQALLDKLTFQEA